MWEQFKAEIAEVVAAIGVRGCRHRQGADGCGQGDLAPHPRPRRGQDLRLHERDRRRLGDDAIPRMYERVLLPLFAWRYEKFDIDKHPWDEGLETLMYVAFEAMRGHLVGPERTGDMYFEELEDRYVLRFDACGSGGRTHSR